MLLTVQKMNLESAVVLYNFWESCRGEEEEEQGKKQDPTTHLLHLLEVSTFDITREEFLGESKIVGHGGIGILVALTALGLCFPMTECQSQCGENPVIRWAILFDFSCNCQPLLHLVAHHQTIRHEGLGDVPLHDLLSLAEFDRALVVLRIDGLVDRVDLAVPRLLVPSDSGHLF